MRYNQKIATCCYCGTRAALELRGGARHELACSNCGAPLHELKRLKSHALGAREVTRPMVERRSTKRDKPRKKRKRSLSQRFMSELWDTAEDLFDIFD